MNKNGVYMILTRYNLRNIQGEEITIPPDAVFELPEKVLQFGTGVLLRGLPDYFIDKANRKGRGVQTDNRSILRRGSRYRVHLPIRLCKAPG